MGYLLFILNVSEETSIAKGTSKATEIPLSSLMKKATTRERQMLRIAAYQGKEEADTIKRNLISKQKQQSTSSYVQEVTKIELNNDLIITVEVGQGCYARSEERRVGKECS